MHLQLTMKRETICYITLFISACYARSDTEDLRRILNRYRDINEKRVDQGSATEYNTCLEDKPFPCKKTDQCISLKHVCDGNNDCEDGWDEEQSVCTAYRRVAVEDLVKFVRQQARWLVPAFFKDVVKSSEDVDKLAHFMSVSPTIDDFSMRLQLGPDMTKKFEDALKFVREGDIRSLESLGMGPDSWAEVNYVFNNMIASGFLGHK